MTLKVRNRLTKIFFVVSIICITAAIISFLAAVFNNAVTPPPVKRFLPFLDRIPVFSYSFPAAMIATALLVLYVPAIIFLILRYFENTPSSEIIFFAGFLLGCLCEGVRILTPLFNLWETFSNFLFFCGRIVFMGRILAPLSFLFTAIASDSNQRQDIERNWTIMIAISMIFAAFVPLNTSQINSNGTITWGLSGEILLTRISFIVIAFISMMISAFKHESKELKTEAFAMVIIITGYAFLITADNFVFIIIGLPALLAGTLKYLETLHKLYMWK